MLRLSETSLYQPVKGFLEALGYEVKAEVHGCDVTAVKGEDLVVVELKTTMNLTLVLQGIDRLKMTDLVYLAVPAPTRTQMAHWSETRQLCRRLGLGLLTIRLRARGGPRVEVIVDPTPYKPRQIQKRRERLLGEFAARSGDHNVGGSNFGIGGKRTRRGLVTAYREDALALAVALREAGPSRIVDLRRTTCCDKAGQILRANHYGWFVREQRGIYDLTVSGHEALVTYADVVARLPSPPGGAA